MKLGDVLPSMRDGHCGFDPDLAGAICGAPADTHFLGPDPTSPTGVFKAFVCDEHRAIAFGGFEVLDWHHTEAGCLTQSQVWISSGTPGDSFCAEPGERAAAEQRELVEVVR